MWIWIGCIEITVAFITALILDCKLEAIENIKLYTIYFYFIFFEWSKWLRESKYTVNSHESDVHI